jgi:hypothetical protein
VIGFEAVSVTAQPPVLGPTFALTFDTELFWGSFDRMTAERFGRTYPDIRGTVGAIIRILERYDVAATWAVVGHLFLESCERDRDGLAHPELRMTRQSHWRGDWYSRDPCTDRARDPLWYGPDILDAIGAATVAQEIACHSFGHAVYGDPAFTREAADADLRACIDVAHRRGLQLRSFVFPRNVEGHHDALRDHGFIAFRGNHARPSARAPLAYRRSRNLVEHIVGSAPPVSPPSERLPGLWDIKGSMLLMSRTGARRLISRQARDRRARAGLDAAVATGGVFHLWTHPFNLASSPAYLTSWLEGVIREAVRLRDQGILTIDTMAGIAQRSEAGVGRTNPRS